MALEEFTECDGAIACDNVLENLNADVDESYWYWLVLIGLFVFFRLLALGILTRKASKFY